MQDQDDRRARCCHLNERRLGNDGGETWKALRWQIMRGASVALLKPFRVGASPPLTCCPAFSSPGNSVFEYRAKLVLE